MEINRHDNPWVQIEQLQMEVERLQVESAKLVDENNRLQEWKDAAIAQAEDMHEYVLATINTEKAREIERQAAKIRNLLIFIAVNVDPTGMSPEDHTICEEACDMHEYVLATINTEKAKEIERLRGENEDLALEAKDAWALVKTMLEKPGPN